MTVYDIRRANARKLAEEIGGIEALANKLNKSRSEIICLIGIESHRKISNKLAAKIEKIFNKSLNWLDVKHETAESFAVPIIDWNQVVTWKSLHQEINSDHLYNERFVLIKNSVNSRCFALKVDNDTMEVPYETSFFKDSIIIVDLDEKPENGSFLITTLNQRQKLTFKQLSIDGDKCFIKPLNPRYPIIELQQLPVVYEVVKQAVLLIENI